MAYYTCKHSVKPFYNALDGAERPTEYQIRVYKVYQCEICHKWFSLIQEEEVE